MNLKSIDLKKLTNVANYLKYNLKSVGCKGNTEFRLNELKCESDWFGVKDRIDELSERSERFPTSDFNSMFLFYKTFAKDKKFWCLELYWKTELGDKLLAAGIWMEEIQEKKSIEFKILRSLDSMALRVPPLIVDKNYKYEAYKRFTEILPEIAKMVGADMFTMYRQDDMHIRILCDIFDKQGILYKSRIFTESQFIDLPDNEEEFTKGLGKSTRKNIKYQTNKLTRHFEKAPDYTNLHGKISDNENGEQALNNFIELYRKSWQCENTYEEYGIDKDILTSYQERLLQHWSSIHALDVSVLSIKGNPIAATGGACLNNTYYATYIIYDREYANYSPGKLLVPFQLKSLIKNGIKHVELGGEGSSWKNSWANYVRPSMQIEFPIGTPKGMILALAKELLGDDNQEAVR